MSIYRTFRSPFVALTIVAALCACGKKGALVPPEALAPAAITDLKVAQKGTSFQASWSAPTRQESGAALTDLTGFLLLRRTVLPPDQDCEECLGAYAELKRVDLEYLQEVRQVGSLYLVEDPYLKEGETYQYKVIAFKGDGARSKDSNKVRRKAVAPPLPPVLQGSPAATEITLEFVPPPATGTWLGYNLYRSRKGESYPVTPINTQPISVNSYRDRNLLGGVTYRYQARTLALIEGETVESTSSNEVELGLAEPD